jgi:hypothetical protein
VTTTPRNGETCFEVVSKPLDDRARLMLRTRPRLLRRVFCWPRDRTSTPGREITVVGDLEALRRPRGDASTARHGHAENVYLWPQRTPRELAYAYPYRGVPYWGMGMGPGWGRGRGVFIGRRFGARWH